MSSTAVGYPPTAIGSPPTAIGCPPTAVDHPPNRHRLPSNRHRLPSNRRRLPSNRRRLHSNCRRLHPGCSSQLSVSTLQPAAFQCATRLPVASIRLQIHSIESSDIQFTTAIPCPPTATACTSTAIGGPPPAIGCTPTAITDARRCPARDNPSYSLEIGPGPSDEGVEGTALGGGGSRSPCLRPFHLPQSWHKGLPLPLDGQVCPTDGNHNATPLMNDRA